MLISYTYLQSSWTKRAAEIGSPQRTEDDANDAPDSTCAQVIHTKDEYVNGVENVNVPEQSEEQQEQFGMWIVDTIYMYICWLLCTKICSSLTIFYICLVCQ